MDTEGTHTEASAADSAAIKRARAFLSDVAALRVPAADAGDAAASVVLKQAESLVCALEADAGTMPELAAMLTA